MFQPINKNMDIDIRDYSFRIERPDGTLGDIHCDGKKGKSVPTPAPGKWIVIPVANAGGQLRRDAMNQKLLEDVLRLKQLFWTTHEPEIWVMHDGRNRLRVMDQGPRWAEAVVALPCRLFETPLSLGLNEADRAWEISEEALTEWTLMEGERWRRGDSIGARWQKHLRRPCAMRASKVGELGHCRNPGGPWVGRSIRCYHAWEVAQRGMLRLLGCDECLRGRERGTTPAWPKALHFKPTPSRMAMERLPEGESWYDYPDADDFDRSEGPVIVNDELP